MVGSLAVLPFSKCLCAVFGEDPVWGLTGHARRGQKGFLHFLLLKSQTLVRGRRRRFGFTGVFCPAAKPSRSLKRCFVHRLLLYFHRLSLCARPRCTPCTCCLQTSLKSGSDAWLPQPKSRFSTHASSVRRRLIVWLQVFPR